ncbi:unnamed protein product [Symbiodinium natans]|uniref:Uncharacterized protein n=1 Tax=Symbiodinium natans TaxID=878477 RepID=A0A812MY39_9DINO|nr:unnamed protein product [Symbiodinium natans]
MSQPCGHVIDLDALNDDDASDVDVSQRSVMDVDEMDLEEPDIPQHVGPGPDTLPGIMQAFRWPYLAAQALGRHMLPAQLQRSCLTRTWKVSTHFSGLGSAELALQLLEHAAAGLTGGVGPQFNLVSACEKQPSRQRVLRTRLPQDCHIFDDIMERFRDLPELSETVDWRGIWSRMPDVFLGQGIAEDMDISGSPCQVWSSMGSRGEDNRIVLFLAWAFLIRTGECKSVIHENMSRFDEGILLELLSDTFEVVTLEVHPWHCGFRIIARPRKYSVLFRRRKIEVVSDVREVYSRLSQSLADWQKQPDLEEFLLTSEQGLLQEENQARASKKLTDKQRGYLQKYQEQGAVRQTRNVVYDLSQSPEKRPIQTSQQTGRLPCMRSGSLLWMPDRRRWLVDAELAALMGFPSSEPLKNLYGVPDIFCPARSQVGTAMHVGCVGLVALVALACARDRS